MYIWVLPLHATWLTGWPQQHVTIQQPKAKATHPAEYFLQEPRQFLCNVKSKTHCVGRQVPCFFQSLHFQQQTWSNIPLVALPLNSLPHRRDTWWDPLLSCCPLNKEMEEGTEVLSPLLPSFLFPLKRNRNLDLLSTYLCIVLYRNSRTYMKKKKTKQHR